MLSLIADVRRDPRDRCGAGAARERFIGATYSHLFSTVNLVGFLLQMFVVSRVFKYLGVGKALFIHPLVAGVGPVEGGDPVGGVNNSRLGVTLSLPAGRHQSFKVPTAPAWWSVPGPTSER